ncbi:MAG: hypothetical protein WDN46_13055 [Methylocella sp.]
MTQLPPQTLPQGQDAGGGPGSKGSGLGGRIRNWFLTGVVVAGPLAVTAYIVWWFIDTVDNWVRRLVPMNIWPDTYLPIRLPGLGVIVAFLSLHSVGFSRSQSCRP